MSDERTSDIPAALTPEQWDGEHRYFIVDGYDSTRNAAGEIHQGPGYLHLTEHQHDRFAVFETVNDLAALIALANAAMNDEDPRKLTRGDVEVLRNAAGYVMAEIPDEENGIVLAPQETAQLQRVYDRLWELSDVIESYLPPTARDRRTRRRPHGRRTTRY